MKRTLLALALLAAATQGNAQTTTTTHHSNSEYMSLGPVAGFGNSWVGNLGNNNFMPSGYLGIGLIYARKAHWGWGAELRASAEGYSFDDTRGATVTASTMYLRLPLRAYYFFGNYKSVVRPKVYLGPTFGVKLAENDSWPNYGNDVQMSNNVGTMRTFDFGLNAGAGVNIKLKKSLWLNMDLGYYQGLTDAVKDNEGNTNLNHNLAFNVGLLFGIK